MADISETLTRCGWCHQIPDFFAYHDHEWGFPVDDDQRIFEKLCLETFQSGLSWRTILNKREHFRRAFSGFDFTQVAQFSSHDVDALLNNPGIVRHRGKIEAVINNAQQATELVAEVGSLAAFFWQYEPIQKVDDYSFRSQSKESHALAKALKQRGWKFVGPTTMYALMQAMGLVNDHETPCVIRARVTAARKRFKKPVPKHQ